MKKEILTLAFVMVAAIINAQGILEKFPELWIWNKKIVTIEDENHRKFKMDNCKAYIDSVLADNPYKTVTEKFDTIKTNGEIYLIQKVSIDFGLVQKTSYSAEEMLGFICKYKDVVDKLFNEEQFRVREENGTVTISNISDNNVLNVEITDKLYKIVIRPFDEDYHYNGNVDYCNKIRLYKVINTSNYSKDRIRVLAAILDGKEIMFK